LANKAIAAIAAVPDRLIRILVPTISKGRALTQLSACIRSLDIGFNRNRGTGAHFRMTALRYTETAIGMHRTMLQPKASDRYDHTPNRQLQCRQDHCPELG
jgi:hypothetical protein